MKKAMFIDVLVAEIGSTTTVVNAFDLKQPKFLGQGQSATTVELGDVCVGLKNAITNLETVLNSKIEWGQMLCASSACGGLKMCVHGLVYDMTVKASKESALGAGAVLKLVTAGKLTPFDIQKVKKQSPNIILIAGGVDYGEKETAIHNFNMLANSGLNVPFIYAGNIANREEISYIAQNSNVKVYICDNVYPKVDVLNVEPTRKVIQNVFEEHIIHAEGMSNVRQMVTGKILPTPGAVMASAKLLYEELGDLVVFDVGGATTDLHSVTNGTEEISLMSIAPEPQAKRTVEGDLGVFVNIPHIVEKIGIEQLEHEFKNAKQLILNSKPVPKTSEEISFISRLTKTAVEVALERHAGKLIDHYGASGKKTVAIGKDLTAVKYVIATGGALTRLPQGESILKGILSMPSSTVLSPRNTSKILIDKHYILASLGVLSCTYKQQALQLLKQSFGIER